MLALFLMSAQPGLGQESEKLLAEVRAAWEKREKDAEKLTAKWRQEQLRPKGSMSRLLPNAGTSEALPARDTKLVGECELYCSGADCRVILNTPVWNVSKKQFDTTVREAALRGGVLKSRMETSASVNPVGKVSKDAWDNWGTGSVWPLIAGFRGTTTTAYGANIDFYTLARRIQLPTGPVIELVQDRTETRGRSRLLVDPRRDYFPTRAESFGRDEQLQVAFSIRLRNDQRFGWVPESWELSSFSGPHLVYTESDHLDDLVLGEPIPGHIFDLTYKPGTFVHDTSGERPRDFLTRDGKGPREILPGEFGGPYEQLVATEAGELLPGGSPSRGGRYWWVVGGAIVALTVGMYSVRRLRRTIRSGPNKGAI
jgi:hypothetical protein